MSMSHEELLEHLRRDHGLGPFPDPGPEVLEIAHYQRHLPDWRDRTLFPHEHAKGAEAS